MSYVDLFDMRDRSLSARIVSWDALWRKLLATPPTERERELADKNVEEVLAYFGE